MTSLTSPISCYLIALQLKANKNALDLSSEDVGVGLVEGRVDLPQFMSVSLLELFLLYFRPV